MNRHYPEVARRAGHRCEYCRAPEVVTGFLFEVEHVYPSSLGGSSDPQNLALACRACNLRKGDMTEGPDPQTRVTAALFDPRTDRWAEHFRYDPDTAEVVGLTPTGRATVALLGMNEPSQVAARGFWVRLQLYP